VIRVPVTTGFPIITRGFETIRRPVFMIVSLCEPTEACKHGETGGLTRPQLPALAGVPRFTVPGSRFDRFRDR